MQHGSAADIVRAAMAAAVGLLVTIALILVFQKQRTDFCAFYTGANIVRTGGAASLYDKQFTLAQERRVAPDLPAVIPSNRPAFYYGAIAPLSLLGYTAAWVCWVSMQMLLLAGCWAWGFRRYGYAAVGVSCLYAPAAIGIAHGQDAVFLLAIAICAYSLTERNRQFAGGAVLGLAVMKVHLIALWPLALIVQKRWRMLAGFMATAIAAAAISISLVGIQGARDWLVLIQDRTVGAENPPLYRLISAEGLFAPAGQTGAALMAFRVLLALGALGAIRKAGLRHLFTVAIFTSLFIAPHVLVYDYTMALLPLWLLIFEELSPAVRYGAIALASPFIFTLVGLRPWWSLAAAAAVLAFLLLLIGQSWTSARTAFSRTSR